MSQRIEDKFSDLPTSRQRRYQLRKREEGRCVICGKWALPDSAYCLHHLVRERERVRRLMCSKRRYLKAKSYLLEKGTPSITPP